MNNFIEVSPLNLLNMSLKKELGRGKLGVLMARAGVGKTACLIHIAFDKLFRGEKLVHISGKFSFNFTELSLVPLDLL